jgi:hypothetical protein
MSAVHSLPPLLPQPPVQGWQLRFASLFDPGRGLAFPCDDHGQVPLDSLPPRALDNYLYARAVVGREFATPTIVRHLDH